MRIPFTCAFMKLLVSDDNTNHTSYLLNFFSAKYKACSGMWKFSQLSRNTFSEKITQNKVYICHKLCMYESGFSHYGLVFRKERYLILLLLSIVFFYLARQLQNQIYQKEVLLRLKSLPM